MHFDNLPFELGMSEANRPIRLRLSTGQSVIDDLLMVKQVSGTETMCGGIEYSLLCLSTRAGMQLKEFIANPIELQFVTDTGDVRSVCGIVGAAAEGQDDGGLATYQLIVRDALSLLEDTCNTRVFRHASEVDITNVILREWREANPIAARAFRFDLGKLKTYPAREFTMQYNESNAAFLRRLWKRRGIAWFIEPGAATVSGDDETPFHTLVLFDDAMSLNANAAGPIRYHPDTGTQKRDGITSWQSVRRLTAGRVTRRSWDYAQAWSMGSADSGENDQGKLGNQFAASLDDYLVDVPHAGADAADYHRLGALRMQRKEYEAKFFRGEGGDRNTFVGQWRRIEGHPEIDSHRPEEREFVVTELRIEAENNLPKALDERAARLFALNHWDHHKGSLVQAGTERAMRFTSRFSCVRRGVPIVPCYDPRVDLPRTEAQTVVVVGPPNEEIHCDQFGRIKVRFPACRAKDHEHAHGAGASDSDADSAWLRPASSWAGERYGAISLPRAGDELLVVFLGGDPDKPIIVGRVHNAKRPPPAFSHASVLPGDRHLSGIVSKEANGQRSNQLRMDDTPGQISAQLESEHGHSQLNLGYLTHPRHDGKAEGRGEGAELRSDQSVAIRGGRGVLISADACLRAAGRQLQRDGMNGVVEALKTVQQQLAELAATHNAESTDGEPLAQLAKHLNRWEGGSNTDGVHNNGGGEAIVAIDAPAGIALGSQANVSIGAQSHVDVVSVGNTQLSAGRKLMLYAMQSVSLFAHKLGVKLVAASGKVDIQAHQDNVEITSSKRIVLVATDEIVLQAPKVTVITQGAQALYGEGAIEHRCTGSHSVKSGSVGFSGPSEGSAISFPLPKTEPVHDQRVRLVDLNSGAPLAHQRYRATMEDGQVVEGSTDGDGMTQVLKSSIPFGQFEIKAIFD